MNKVTTRLEGLGFGRRGRRWECPVKEHHNFTLAVDENVDGAILVHCFGGCSTKDVLAEIGLSMRDLFA